MMESFLLPICSVMQCEQHCSSSKTPLKFMNIFPLQGNVYIYTLESQQACLILLCLCIS